MPTWNALDYKMIGADFVMPRMFRARQIFPRPHLENPGEETAAALGRLPLPDLSGKSVALTAGSRGITDQVVIIKAAVDFLKGRGALPFIVPAMGSHGNADAVAQAEISAAYGVTEAAMGVPVRSSLETVELGRTAAGYPVFCDASAAAADYVMPINRIKPHTDFKGELESGLCKMLVIGLGKHNGATLMHSRGFLAFGHLLPLAAETFIASGKVLCGVGIMENAYDETMRIDVIMPQDIIAREKELLVMAKTALPRFLVDGIDVLVVEEIGKNISGSGMDANITGRVSSNHPGFPEAKIGRIVVLGISEQSGGNASGLGMADFVTLEFVRVMDFGITYTNGITSRSPEGTRLPMIANNDRDAIRMAMFCASGVDTAPDRIRIVQIRNTLEMTEMLLSESYLASIRNDRRFEVLGEPSPMTFTPEGRLRRLF